jgi:hypothetical protein
MMIRASFRRGIILALAACVVGPLPLYGQDVTFQASLDKNPVGLGDQVVFSLVLTNAGTGGGKNLKLPDLSRFHVMSGPNQSSSMQIVNGAVSSSMTYTYVLQPKETGKFTIGPISIEAGGKTLQSQPITLEVVKGQPQAKKAPVGQDDLGAQIGDNLFLKATIDKSHVVQGEQVNLVFKLYTRVRIVNYGVDKNPTMTGFWSEDVETPKNITLSNEVVNGKQYQVGVIKRVALFPTQSGTLEISPMEVQTVVQVQPQRSQDPFESFFRDPFGRQMNYVVKSEPVRINVDPLPPGALPEFKGAVGQFALSAAVDKRTTRTNEPVSLKITISGTGNIKLLESPAVDVPADFEQYTPKVSDNINRNSEKISGSKTFEYLYIPRYPGLKVIQPVTFYYFDLGKREYVKLRSPQLELNVEQGSAPLTPQIAGSPREDVRLLSQDIRFIKIGTPAFTRPTQPLHKSIPFVILLVLPVLGVAGAYAFARNRQAVMLDEAGYRNRRAIKVAQKGLKQADYLLKEKSGSHGEPSSMQRLRFYAEVSRALWKYLGDKLGIPQAEFSVERAVEVLKEKSVDNGLVHAVRILLESCDMARFAPTSLEISAMQKTYDEARRIIVELEHALK